MTKLRLKFSIFYYVFQVRITGKDLASIEKSKAIIRNLTMVPSVGDIYRLHLCSVFLFSSIAKDVYHVQMKLIL